VSGAFDPYHRWLGISPKDQPPNHYRLLGIDVFESDHEVIRDAADRQMAHVRTYQLGPHVDLSQQILNELAAAKACLLDADKKAIYDASLRKSPPPTAKVAASSNEIYGVASAANNAPPELPPRLFPIPQHQPSIATTPRKPNFWKAHWIEITSVATGTMGIVLFAFVFTSPSAPPSEKPKQSDFVLIAPDEEPKEDTVAVPNQTPTIEPPKLAKVTDVTVNQGALVQFPIGVAHHGTNRASLRFELAPGSPEGAKIHPVSGQFSWFANTSGDYAITVRASVEGQEKLADSTTFQVHVRNEAQPPTIRRIPPQAVNAGDSLTFRVHANHPSASKNLTYELLDAPEWASIDAATGVVLCQPASSERTGEYSLTVRAHSPANNVPPAQRIVVISVTPSKESLGTALKNSIPSIAGHAPSPMPSTTGSLPTFSIELPSGKVLRSSDVDLQNFVHSEIDRLSAKCRNNSPDVVGFYQDGSGAVASVTSIRGNKPHGTAIFFHPGAALHNPQPQYLITYRNGRWDGPIAMWNAKGQECFWGTYSNGQRNGLMCLIKDNAVDAVLECTRNQADTVHLVARNRVTKTFTNYDNALADIAAAPILKELNAIEQEMKSDNREFCDRVKQGVQMRVGAVNSQKRAAASARSAGRAAAQEATIHTLRKAAGY
jgi:hypothetical protein